MNNSIIDVMSLNHFLIYTLLGLLFPHKWILAISVMILWETFEVFLVKTPWAYELMKKYWIVPEIYWNENAVNKASDIVFNMCGYAFGNMLAYRI